MILSFAYLKRQTLKSQEYSNSYAKIEGNTKEIGVLYYHNKITFLKKVQKSAKYTHPERIRSKKNSCEYSIKKK